MKNKIKKKVLVVLTTLLSIVGICYHSQNINVYVNKKYVATSNTSKTSIKKGVATINGLSIRDSNSARGKYLGSLMTNDVVEIEKVMSNGWYKIKYNKGSAYVNSSYIKLDTDKSEVRVLNSGKPKNNNLKVKSKAGTSYSSLGTIDKNTTVQIVDVDSKGWYKIKYNNDYGYVNGTYINVTGASTPTVKTGKTTTNLNNFLFVGDSFTYFLSDTIKANNKNPYISAQSGSRPFYWLDKVGNMTSNSNVDGIVLLIGVNGIVYNGNDNSTTNINDTKKLIRKLMVKYPNKTIYVQKVFPVAKTFTSSGVSSSNINNYIVKYNSSISSFCKSFKNVKYIDATNGFINKSGYLIKTSDGLHISTNYNSTFYKNILNAVKKTGK